MTNYTEKAYWENLVKMSLSRYFVLYAINKKSMHGYEISKWIGAVTKDCCCPTEGSLYPMLKEFESGGYVTSQVVSVSGRERKVYTITEKGLEALSVAKDVWGHTLELLRESMQ
jgi:DNA-binding PadR family transcriptional regulator